MLYYTILHCTTLSSNTIHHNTPYIIQTKLLEINFLGGSPQVADAILGNEMFTHYDKVYVARLCEQSGLPQRALEHYTEPADIKRVLQNSAGALNPEFLVSFFGSVSQESSIDILKDLLSRNIRQNLQVKDCMKGVLKEHMDVVFPRPNTYILEIILPFFLSFSV